MTDAQPARVRPALLTIGIVAVIGAALLLIGLISIKSTLNILDYDDGLLAGAAGALMLLISIIQLMVRAVRLGMRK
jgi:hypothetical protein